MNKFPIYLDYIESVESTNSVIKEKVLLKNLPEYYVLNTNYQKSGRGRHGNTWESEWGMNLLASWIFFPDFLEPANQFSLTVFVSLSLIDYLKERGINAKIKWPNDIYVKNEKIAGILIENTIEGSSLSSSVIGIGLNINQTTFPASVPNPVSMKQLTHLTYDVKEEIQLLHQHLWKGYTNLKHEDGGQLFSRYQETLYRLNQYSHYEDNYGAFIGKIIDVERDGRLSVVKKSREIRQYLFGEIRFLEND